MDDLDSSAAKQQRASDIAHLREVASYWTKKADELEATTPQHPDDCDCGGYEAGKYAGRCKHRDASQETTRAFIPYGGYSLKPNETLWCPECSGWSAPNSDVTSHNGDCRIATAFIACPRCGIKGESPDKTVRCRLCNRKRPESI